MGTQQNIDELVRMKLPLVQAEYESYHASSSRIMDRISSLYTWEVTLLAAFIALNAERDALSYRSGIAMLVVIGAFAIYDGSQRAMLRAIGEDALIIEARLQETDLAKFRNNIVAWQFGNTILAGRPIRLKRRMIVRALFELSLIFWHGSLAVAFLAFVWWAS